jgi:hypothetical protein
MIGEELYCPFCVTSWICDGPHIILENEQRNFFEYVNYSKEDYIYNTLYEIKAYSKEKGIDLSELSNRVKERIQRRDR